MTHFASFPVEVRSTDKNDPKSPGGSLSRSSIVEYRAISSKSAERVRSWVSRPSKRRSNVHAVKSSNKYQRRGSVFRYGPWRARIRPWFSATIQKSGDRVQGPRNLIHMQMDARDRGTKAHLCRENARGWRKTLASSTKDGISERARAGRRGGFIKRLDYRYRDAACFNISKQCISLPRAV